VAVELVAAGLAAVVVVLVVVAGDFVVAGDDFVVAVVDDVAGDLAVAGAGEVFAVPCAKLSDAGSAASRAIVRMSLMRFIYGMELSVLMVRRSSSGMRDP
jgi:predicted RecA/RadA family phage recombinase